MNEPSTTYLDPHCIFCKIIKGEVPTYKVYEDELAFAFLDIRPINPGHILVIPKHHEPVFHNLEDRQYMAVMKTVKKLSTLVQEKMSPKKVGLIVAGFEVNHAHVHIVPMHGFHDITSKHLLDNTLKKATNEELLHTQGILV